MMENSEMTIYGILTALAVMALISGTGLVSNALGKAKATIRELQGDLTETRRALERSQAEGVKLRSMLNAANARNDELQRAADSLSETATKWRRQYERWKKIANKSIGKAKGLTDEAIRFAGELESMINDMKSSKTDKPCR